MSLTNLQVFDSSPTVSESEEITRARRRTEKEIENYIAYKMNPMSTNIPL